MTRRTPQLETAILDGFADGCSLRFMCHHTGISRSAFLKWMQGDPCLARRYTEAHLLHAQTLVDDCVAIADNPTIELEDGRPGDGTDAAGLMRYARFRIDARLKVARIYFKRHEAALARQMEEREASADVVDAATGAEAASPEPNEAVPPPVGQNRHARRAAKACGKRLRSRRAAAISARPALAICGASNSS